MIKNVVVKGLIKKSTSKLRLLKSKALKCIIPSHIIICVRICFERMNLSHIKTTFNVKVVGVVTHTLSLGLAWLAMSTMVDP